MGRNEIVDLYDAAGHVVGTATRSRMRAENLRHGATAVIVRDSRGRIFVHRRTPTKDVYPGLLDYCAGGVIQAGESPDDSAAREVFEELGVEGVTLRRFGVGTYDDDHTSYVAFLYETVFDGPMRLQEEEVSWGDWVDVHELLTRLDREPEQFVPDSTALARSHLDVLACRAEKQARKRASARDTVTRLTRATR